MSSPSSLFSACSTPDTDDDVENDDLPDVVNEDGRTETSEHADLALSQVLDAHDDVVFDGLHRLSSEMRFGGGPEETQSHLPKSQAPEATRSIPPIPGLYIFPSVVPPDPAQRALDGIAQADHFHGGKRNQVMLFTPPPRPPSPPCPAPPPPGGPSPSPPHPPASTLPRHLDHLLSSLSDLLRPLLPPKTHHTAFSQPLARQAILNLYPPGQGITPHIDLPSRYADGIVGVSLTGGTVLDFTRSMDRRGLADDALGEGDKPGESGRYSVYVPPRSVYVLSGEARWEWEHGIAARDRDVVEGVTVLRDVRVSVTFRWMRDGGDVLG